MWASIIQNFEKKKKTKIQKTKIVISLFLTHMIINKVINLQIKEKENGLSLSYKVSIYTQKRSI